MPPRARQLEGILAEQQRLRILEGAAWALAEHGCAALTVERILVAASISEATFYAHFEDRRECLVAAHEAVFSRLAACLFRACAEASAWPAKLAAGVRAAIDFAIENPQEAQLLLIDAVAADGPLAARALESNDYLVALLRHGRDYPSPFELPELTERGMVGAATSLVGSRLLVGEIEDIRRISPEIVQLFLTPYVGCREAARLVRACD